MRRIFLKGFSLIELLITIAIITIIMTIGLPSFNAILDSNKLKGGSDALYFMLSLTKTESIKRNKNVYLKITSGENWCIGVNDDNANCNCNATPSTCNIASINSNEYKELTLTSNYILPYFDRVRGVFNEPDKLFTLQSGSNRLVKIRVNIMGLVRMCGVNGALGLYTC